MATSSLVGEGYDLIGTRPSTSSPGTTEFYNTQSGIGFEQPSYLSNFVNTLYGKQTTSANVFDILKQGNIAQPRAVVSSEGARNQVYDAANTLSKASTSSGPTSELNNQVNTLIQSLESVGGSLSPDQADLLSKLRTTSSSNISALATGNAANDAKDYKGLVNSAGQFTSGQTQQANILSQLLSSLQQRTSDIQTIQSLFSPSQEEQQTTQSLNKTKQDIRNLDASTLAGQVSVEGQPIPMEIIRGQQAQIQKLSDLKRIGLSNELQGYVDLLSSQVATRQQKLEAAKFVFDANRQTTLDSIALYKEMAPQNIATNVDAQTGEMTVVMRNPLTGEIYKQNLGQVQTPQRWLDNVKLAQEAGVTTLFFSRDRKTIINTQTGREYETPEQFFADGGSFDSQWMKNNVKFGVKSLQQQQLDLQRQQLDSTKYQAITNPVTGESLVFNPKTGTFTPGASGPGSPSDPSSQPYFGLGPKLYDAGSKIATQFDNEKVVQNFNVINEGKEFADSLPADTSSPADDQGLLYAFAKAMDPNSVVREGEYATVQKYSQSWLESFGFNAKRVVDNGEFLTREAREALKNTINTKYEASLGNYQNVFNEYSRRIDGAVGRSDYGKLFLTDYSKAYQTSDLDSLWNSIAPSDTQSSNFVVPDGKKIDINLPAGTSKTLASAAMTKFAPGSFGDQCGVFVRKVASAFGLTYPTLGDSLTSKSSAVSKYGVAPQNVGIGSVVVTKENPTYGHVAWIIGMNSQGYVVAESNFKQSNKVSYGRVIPYNSSKLIGFINPTIKTSNTTRIA